MNVGQVLGENSEDPAMITRAFVESLNRQGKSRKLQQEVGVVFWGQDTCRVIIEKQINMHFLGDNSRQIYFKL